MENPIPLALDATLLQQALVMLAAFFAGLTAISLFSRVQFSLAGGHATALASYMRDERPPDLVERFGAWLLRRFPSLTSVAELGRHRRWLQLVSAPPSPAAVIGMAVLLALSGVGLAVATGIPALVLLGIVGFVYPFARLRRQANAVRRGVQRALPELTALMAAEMAAGNPPDRALERAAEWGGPLARLMGSVVDRARATGRPVFGRGDLPGILTEVVADYDLPALRAFASQIDLAARKGAAGPELMEGLARTLIIEYKDRALREAEALDNRLAVPSVLFFFLPFLFLILAPMLVPLLSIL